MLSRSLSSSQPSPAASSVRLRLPATTGSCTAASLLRVRFASTALKDSRRFLLPERGGAGAWAASGVGGGGETSLAEPAHPPSSSSASASSPSPSGSLTGGAAAPSKCIYDISSERWNISVQHFRDIRKTRASSGYLPYTWSIYQRDALFSITVTGGGRRACAASVAAMRLSASNKVLAYRSSVCTNAVWRLESLAAPRRKPRLAVSPCVARWLLLLLQRRRQRWLRV